MGAGWLIAVIKIIIFLKGLAAAFFVYLVYKPLRFCLRLVFYQLVVRFYSWYLPLAKKFGWFGRQRRALPLVFHQRLVHIFLILISVFLILVNLTGPTRAGGLTEKAQNTILYDLIKSEYDNYEEDEQYVVETFDQEAVISPLQQSYLENLSSVRAQPRVNMNGEEEAADETISTAQDGSALVKPDIASTRISKRTRTGPVVHTVVPGDTVSTIAEEFEISVSTILWENNLSAYSLIRPGDQLTILPQSGLTHKVAKGENLGSLAKKYGVTEEEIMTANKLAAGAVLAVGEKLFVPGGKKVNYPAPAPKTYSGLAAIKNIITAPSAKPVPGNKMNWPTVGNRLTQYFSWRHLAIDIANKTGTPIYAADAGTVEYLGWGKGYGNQIVIDHGGGKKTRYAHLSSFSVKNGAKVDKGQTIGAMGSTGWSTGSHLHFEVIINGAKNNPLNYLR